MEFITGIIKPALLILIPFTWVLGMRLKPRISDHGRLKVVIHALVIAIAVVMGFIFSDYEGMRRVGEAVVVYGLHGVVCVWLASRLYDKVRAQ